ncbi:hypothetical protein [Burkholderia multivorans]|uniref:hypothetical protein n=1 Tax=Burkholderia multivorans TaxID=87883 RepID=UPI001C242339|nr:hypothetical protein [Burkholderia multivorans]MBU9310902.1 hypothetical protein [Burkholderia multivorans]
MTSKPSDDLLTRCRELLENRQMNDSSSPALCALADTFHPAIPPHVRLSMAELKTHREAMRTLLDNAQQPSGEVTEADLIALLPGTYYMDPPDGGDVSLLEQLRRMAADAGRYRWMRAHYTRFVALPDDGPELDLQAIGEIGDAYEGQVLDQTVDAARAQGGES